MGGGGEMRGRWEVRRTGGGGSEVMRGRAAGPGTGSEESPPHAPCWVSFMTI